jgi:hypothetical protein
LALDSGQLVAILGAITALIIAVGQLIRETRITRQHINGRMSELLELTRESAKAQGVLETKNALGPPDPPR